MIKQITAASRGAIEVLLQQNFNITEIASQIGVHKSTISREIKSRSTANGYIAHFAQMDYETKRKRCKKRRKLEVSQTQKYVVEKLGFGWSPEQISGRMKLEGRDDRVSHETIYAWVYSDEWAYKREKLYQYLRFGRRRRRKWCSRRASRDKIPNRVSIHERPEEVKQRTVFGHFEADSVIYPNKYVISTLNELTTGLVRFTKLQRKTAALTAIAHANQLKDFNNQGLPTLTLTLDNGIEHMEHGHISKVTGVNIYFADPYCSSQRGANENVNGLLRGFLPKRHDISNLTQQELDDIADELNNRPRKRLGYKTPNEVYNSLLVKQKGSSVAFENRI